MASPICSLRVFPGIVTRNNLVSPNLGMRTAPRITEVTDAQEAEDTTVSMLPTMQISRLALSPNAAYEQSFEPLFRGQQCPYKNRIAKLYITHSYSYS